MVFFWKYKGVFIMKFSFLCTLCRAVTLCVLTVFSSAYAVEICATDMSDPDGDQWGWENNMSCHVGPYNPPVYPVCESNESDTDGDGWGWEQGQTCITDNSADPGIDIDTAGLVILNEEFGSRIEGDSVHFYKFEVTEHAGITASFNAGQPGDYDYAILNADGGALWEGLLSLEGGACLTEGTYYFSISSFFFEESGADNYTVSLNTIDLNCADPAEIIELSEGDWWAGDDGYFYRSIATDSSDRVISKLDSDGSVQWELAVSGSVSSVQTLDSGGVLVYTYNDVQFIDDLGNPVWQFDTAFVQPEGVIAGATILVLNEELDYTVYAINLNDGSVRWRYDYASNDFIEIVRVTDEGKVTLRKENSFLVFD